MRTVGWYFRTICIMVVMTSVLTLAIAFVTTYARDFLLRAGYHGIDVPWLLDARIIAAIWFLLGAWIAYRTLAHLYARNAHKPAQAFESASIESK